MDAWVKKGLIALLVIYSGVIFWTFHDYGITPDEGHHVQYGASVMAWYTSGFQDRSIFTWADVWLYGGFYDTVVHLITRISPLDLYDTRHLINAFVGLLGVLIAYRLGALFGSPWVGLLAAVFLILTPRFYGHGFNNNKDIPFAVLYLLSLFWQIKVLSALPRVSWRWVAMTGLVTGLAMGIRVGGVLLVGYAGLFWGMWSVLCWRNGRDTLGTVVKDYVLRMGVMFGIAYGVMLIFWPWAQTDPLRHPFKALTVFSKFPGGHLNFFEGQHFHSYDIPWYYAPKWLLLTLPEFVLVGVVLFGLGVVVYRRTDLLNLQTGLLGFSVFFPLIYLVVSGTSLYNATRHFLFVVPPLVVIAALGCYVIFQGLKNKWRVVLYAVVGVMVMVTLVDMIRLHPFQTAFFNRSVAGGLAGASSAYDTDNYNNGYKQGVLWLHDHAEQGESDRIRVVGGAAIDKILDMSRFAIGGVAWNADYYLTTTNMRLHTVIPGEVVHTVERMGVPLLYVIRPDTTQKAEPLFVQDPFPYRDMMWGNFYREEKRWDEALTHYKNGLSLEGSQADVYRLMGEVYHAQKAHQKAAEYYRKALDAGANFVTVGTKLGNVLQGLGHFEEAIPYYERALEVRPNYLGALTNLARALYSLRRNEDAVWPLEKIVTLARDQSIHFQRLGLVYYQLGRTADAVTTFEKAITLNERSMTAWYHLGLALEQLEDMERAERVYLEALQIESHRADILLRLASIYKSNKSYDTAVRVLMTLLEHHPSSWQGYYALGEVYEALDDQQVAIVAYQKVLSLNPDYEYAKMRLSKLIP
jgi:tetratricopeptide (TPR) repeat protein